LRLIQAAPFPSISQTIFATELFYSILMSTIASAVNTVIVCFAEGPAEFEANHPELSRKMRETWISFYPDCGV